MKRVRVGIVGFGTVGRATADIIFGHAELIEPAEQRQARRHGRLPTFRNETRKHSVGCALRFRLEGGCPAHDVDIVMETIGGTNQSLQLVRATLELGKPVATANKNLPAEYGDELFAVAASRNLPIGFEASVGGGIPILMVIQESAAGDRLSARRSQGGLRYLS